LSVNSFNGSCCAERLGIFWRLFIRRLPINMSNAYRYGVHQNLTRQELFFFVFIDETCKELGVDDVVSVALILAGQN